MSFKQPKPPSAVLISEALSWISCVDKSETLIRLDQHDSGEYKCHAFEPKQPEQ